MYLAGVIALLILAVHHAASTIIKQPELCNGGYCLPKHLCPTGQANDVPTPGLNDLITLQVDEENECGDFMKICCAGSSIINATATETNDAVPQVAQECGIPNSQGLVYNVESNLTYAKYAEFPWTVVIYQITFSSNDIELIHVGGGTLIHPKFVVTAAHTLKKPHRYEARFGEWNMKSDAEAYPAQDIGIEEVIAHPSYRDTCTPENDIALGVLKKSVVYSPHIRPLCLPNERDLFFGKRCVASGWGVDVRTGQPASIMKRIELNVVPRLLCQQLYQLADGDSSFQLHRSAICARAAELQDTCDKDGGTPMACPKEDGTYVLAGITSWGLKCGNPDAPGVYVDVGKFVCWIKNTIEGYEELHAEE
uniref:Peptidase S1 domain-containing protein n=1 Tax=Anopheles culicifacies TaxID=139723 RepID=A0A182LSK4_9DIPT